MSKSALRKDKTCLNCSHVVDQRFCPNCGQENIESRKTFHHLFIHFFEDLTHYENAFWRTIKNLLFKPSALTKEYLSGKRLSYLAPVRLYIFISFITFFLIAVISDSEDHLLKANQTVTIPVKDKNGVVKDSIVSSKKIKVSEALKIAEEATKKPDSSHPGDFYYKSSGNSDSFNFGYGSLKELDSMQKFGPKSEKRNGLEYWFLKKTLMVKEHNSTAEIIEKFKESFGHNISKVLFIYMPIFAFFLWLFHSKKRWYYFDHGIFTLHYFSFLLLIILLMFLVDWLLSFGGENGILQGINYAIHFGAMAWMFYYFFPAHHRFYGESRIVSFIKSMVLFFINCILIFCILTLFALYTFINIH